jgi:hypothetical protein
MEEAEHKARTVASGFYNYFEEQESWNSMVALCRRSRKTVTNWMWKER